MNRYFYFILFFVSSLAFAADDSQSSFSWLFDRVNSIALFFDEVPNIIQRGLASLIEFYYYGVIQAKIMAIKFAYGVAKQISSDLMISQQMATYLSLLPSNLQYALHVLGFINAINLIVNCLLTRFVLGLVGW